MYIVLLISLNIMNRNYLAHMLVIVFIIQICNSASIILKTQDFNTIQFDPKVAGLSYPEYIKIDETLTNLTVQIYNMTSESLTWKYNFTKLFASSCQYALEHLDYGYYTYFPLYRVVGDCSNSTHSVVYNIKIYRTGDTQFLKGQVTPLSVDELNCQQGPLKVQYFYSSKGQPDTFVYRLCIKNQNQTQTQSLYRQFIANGSKPYIFKQDSIERLTGLTNISLVDMQLGLGIDGKYNAYLSKTNGLIINGGSKYIQTIWKIPGNEQPYKLQKLCWSNSLAILTEGYIYFVTVTIGNNQSIAVNLVRKTDKINIDSTSRCSFFAIGHNAVCSILNSSITTWYIYSQDKTVIPTNQTQVFNKTFTPYLSEDLCSTNSFYQDKSKYQLYFKGVKSQQKMTKNKISLVKTPLMLYGQVVNFLDTQSLFVVSLNSTNATHNYIYTVSYTKANFDRSPLIIKTELMTKNISDIMIQYQNRKDYYNFPVVTTIYTDNLANRTNFQVYLCTNKVNGTFSVYKNFTLQLPISNLGYLQNQGNVSQFFYAVKTPLQKNAYGTFTFNGNTQLRYPYQFEANSFKVCSITSVNNQILFYRQDLPGLTVMRAGFRNKNFLALDGVKSYPEYKFFTVQCIHDGLILYNSAQKKIIKLDNDLQVVSQIDVQFEALKFTKDYVLLKNSQYIQIRSLSTGDVVSVNKWSLDDILTNIHSPGFINKLESHYYQFTSSQSKSREKLMREE